MVPKDAWLQLLSAGLPLSADVIARASVILGAVQGRAVRAFGPTSKRIVEAARAWGSDAEWEQVRGASLKSDQVAALLALLTKWSAALASEGDSPAPPGAAVIPSEAAPEEPSVPSSSDSPVGLSLSAADWDATREFLANRRASEQATSLSSAKPATGWEEFKTAAVSRGPPPLSISFVSPLFNFRLGSGILAGATPRDAAQAELDGASDLPDAQLIELRRALPVLADRPGLAIPAAWNSVRVLSVYQEGVLRAFISGCEWSMKRSRPSVPVVSNGGIACSTKNARIIVSRGVASHPREGDLEDCAR
jgi:hypothetical protein